ncbi:MAG TPA: CAP domain-containing protein, partial [Abditibacteriaceae bacterium]|nr:CAP domain-containing protein [Abditibacteriaceae bacterium]
MKFLTRSAVFVGLSSTLVLLGLAKNAFPAPDAPHRVLDARFVRVAATQNARAARSNRSAVAVRTTTPVRVAQNNAQLAAFERDMALLVNAARADAGLPSLVYDESLAQVARAHSLEMRNRNYFAHESPTASLRHPQDRYRAAFRRTPAMISENVYREWGTPRRVSSAQVGRGHVSLMNSP